MKIENIYRQISENLHEEVVERLVSKGQVTIERIVSYHHSSPKSGWYDQQENEWVMILKAQARLSFEDQSSHFLQPGDYLHIRSHQKHKVDWTKPGEVTIGLAVGFIDFSIMHAAMNVYQHTTAAIKQIDHEWFNCLMFSQFTLTQIYIINKNIS